MRVILSGQAARLRKNVKTRINLLFAVRNGIYMAKRKIKSKMKYKGSHKHTQKAASAASTASKNEGLPQAQNVERQISHADKHESHRKIMMRVITLIVALITIAGLVFVFPFEFNNANMSTDANAYNETVEIGATPAAADRADGIVSTSANRAVETSNSTEASGEFIATAGAANPEIAMTPQGAGMFTVKNLVLIACGFAVGFLLGEIFRRIHARQNPPGGETKR
jgi:hypothetical protein